VFFGIPMLLAFLGSFGLYTIGTESRFTLDYYRALFEVRAYRDGLYFTLYLAFTSTILSLLISIPLAALLQKPFAGKKTFNALYKVPLIVPSIVAAFLVLTMLDQGGILMRVFAQFGMGFPKLVRDPWAIGTIIAMTWKFVPFMTLIIGGSMAGIPRDVLEAARTLRAGPLTVFLRIQIPLALPGITAATLLVFIIAMGAFVIPNLLGPVYPLPLSVLMYERAFERAQWGIVAAMGTLITVVSCGVLLTYYRLTRKAQNAFSAGR
jgi:putative spermidine/putrescine transport system permease protein